MQDRTDRKGANACERFTAAFALLFGTFIMLEARTAASAAALTGDALFAVLLVRGLPRLRRVRNPVVRYFGVTLPLAGFYGLYLQTGLLDPAHVHWHDASLAELQGYLLPRVPYLPWSPIREWFVFAYLSYEPILVAGTVALFAPGTAASQRRTGDAVRRLCYTLAGCFVIGLSYPAMSPRYVTPELQLRHLGSGPFSWLAVVAGRGAMVPGTSFPSAHVAAVVTLMWDLWAARRGLFWLLLPLVASMTAGTVLFLFHYVPDVIAAVVVAVAAVAVDDWLVARQAARRGPRPKTLKATAESPPQ
jgi:hypothetical protein